MKGGVGAPAKKRWRWLVIGVLCLVVFSMLVPLIFLLGLHNGFHSTAVGYVNEGQSSTSAIQSSQVRDVLQQFRPATKDAFRNLSDGAKNKTIEKNATSSSQHRRDASVPPSMPHPPLNTNNTGVGGTVETDETNQDVKGSRVRVKGFVDHSETACEAKFGSYCIWHYEHKEEMKDSMVKKLKDSLFVARSYFPTIAKLPKQDKLSREMKQSIQDVERVLSDTTTDADLPPLTEKKLQRLNAVIEKAKLFPVDCNNVDKKLRQIYDMTEDEANFHMKQSAFLYQLAVQTMPKSLHCLFMRLTVEHFKSTSQDMELPQAEKLSDPSLRHYVIFSKNMLAASVVINSTVMHAKESGNQVFHVLTDAQNYFAMKFWFFRNTYKDALVEVLNIEHLTSDSQKSTSSQLSLPQEFRVSFNDNQTSTHMKTEYISIFSHSHYLLPVIFHNLKKVVVLDEDVVVQRDLSDLWSVNMNGKVNGAVQSCSVRLGQLRRYLGKHSFNKKSCAWMSGLNVIDLVRWRELDLSETYRNLVTKWLASGENSSEAIVLHASLLTFHDLIYTLDSALVVSGLGHDYAVDVRTIKRASVLHYNGNMKPWLDLGIPAYRYYWKKFLNREDQFLSQCNVNP